MDLDFIQDSFSDFGMTFDESDSELIENLKRFSAIYDVEPGDIVDEIIAMLTNLKKSHFDSGMLDQVERKLNAKAVKRKAEVTSSAKRSALTNLRLPLRERDMKFDDTVMSCHDESATEMDTSMLSQLGEFDPSSGAVVLPREYVEFALVRGSLGSSKYYGRRDSGNKVIEHRGKYYDKATPAGEVSTAIVSGTPSHFIASEKAVDVIEEKFQWLHDFSMAVRESNPDIQEFVSPAEIITEDSCVYGELITDGPLTFKVDDANIALQCDDDIGTVLKLDMSRLSEFSVFPGQAVCFVGTNEDGLTFCPSKQLFAKKPPMARVDTSSDSACIWVAAGPFTWSESASFEPLFDLLRKAKKEQPDVLILMGPFVDRRNSFVQSAQCDRAFQQLFDQLIINCAQYLKGSRTLLVVQPSPNRDAAVTPSFPTPPVQLSNNAKKKIEGSNIEFVADPCILRVNGVEVALTGNEAIGHLSRAEWYRAENKENTDRFARLYENFFKQSSLLPLWPVDLPCDTVGVRRHCNLRSTPHLLVNPCVLNAQIKSVSGCICLNPGLLSRGATGGTFARVDVAVGKAPEGEGSLVDYAHVVVEKI